jgi:rhamnogalacturonan endolyase
MHDHVYRMGIAWQNTAYNQPPHLGYFLPDYINGKLTAIQTVALPSEEKQQIFDLKGCRQQVLRLGLNIIRENGTVKKVFKK